MFFFALVFAVAPREQKKGPPFGSPFKSQLSGDYSAGTASFGAGANSSSG